MNYNRAQMKQNAKAAMAAARPKAWLVTLVFLALLTLVPTGVNALANILSGASLMTFLGKLVDLLENIEFARPEQLVSMSLSFIGVSAALSSVASIVITIFRILMNYGYAGYSLQVYRRESQAGIGSLFLGVPLFGSVILSALLVWIFSFLWGFLIYGLTIIAAVLLILFLDSGSGIAGLLTILLVVVAVVAHGLITLRYTLTPYFVMSRKLDGSAAVKASTQAMKGNLWKRLVLELSFLGWEMLLGLICFLAALICFVLATLVSGNAILDLVGQLDRYRYYSDLSPALELLLSGLRGIVIPYAVAMVVTALVQLPMQLWLMTYKNVAYAGFFQEIVGSQNQAPIPVAAAQFASGQPTPPFASDMSAPAAPIVPIPAAPDVPPSPATPTYTPFDKWTGAPQAPVEEIPAAPEAPPIAPVVPETPPIAPETPPITPEDPEG